MYSELSISAGNGGGASRARVRAPNHYARTVLALYIARPQIIQGNRIFMFDVVLK